MTDRDQKTGEEARESRETREARETLERVRRESETVGSSSMAKLGRRMGSHFGGEDAVGPDGTVDPIELWGRRIGRALSVVAFVGLSLWLAHQLGWF